MRSLVYFLIALCATTILSYAADAPKFSPAEQEVIDVSNARMEAAAKRDTAAWSRYVADDCLFVLDDGSLISNCWSITPAANPIAQFC